MTWLGLDWDGQTWFQSEFANRHAEVAQAVAGERPCLSLLDDARRSWRRTREAAKPSGGRSGSKPLARLRAGRQRPSAPFVVRLQGAAGGRDGDRRQVQGRVTVQNSELDDFVLLRSDGSPTYMLAVVVDDHDMGVTHVIRGDDHLNNAFRQLAIIRAMGWPEPVYGHVPLIHGQDGAKLSKRHGALGVDAYRDELGILPEALFNYLLRLGWGHGDEEIISPRQSDRGGSNLGAVGSRRRASTPRSSRI